MFRGFKGQIQERKRERERDYLGVGVLYFNTFLVLGSYRSYLYLTSIYFFPGSTPKQGYSHRERERETERQRKRERERERQRESERGPQKHEPQNRVDPAGLGLRLEG